MEATKVADWFKQEKGEVLLFTLQIDFYSLVTESVSMLLQSTWRMADDLFMDGGF